MKLLANPVFVIIWSIRLPKQEASSSLGTSDQGWCWHWETFQGVTQVPTCQPCLLVHTLPCCSWSAPSRLPPRPPSPPSSLHSRLLSLPLPPFLSRVKQKDTFPCLFLPAAPWRCWCHYFFFFLKWKLMLDRETCWKSVQLYEDFWSSLSGYNVKILLILYKVLYSYRYHTQFMYRLKLQCLISSPSHSFDKFYWVSTMC